MQIFKISRALIGGLLLTVCTLFGASAETQTAYEWKDAGIGTPPIAGSYNWEKKTLTVTGTGAGLNIKQMDECHFVYVTQEAGDFEVVARLVDIKENAVTGIMVRADNSVNGAMAALYFKANDNVAGWMSRIPGALPGTPSQIFSAEIPLARKSLPPAPESDLNKTTKPSLDTVPAKSDSEKPAELGLELDQPEPTPELIPVPKLPLWIKMVRVGKNIGVYKSRDGKLWVQLSNVSGGPIAIEGKLELGFFVASVASGNPVTASFDSIQIGAPNLRYRTSWVGNTFGSRDEDKHVSNALSAMWVAPDGTCYTSSYWDEGGNPVTSYRDGKVARGLPISTPQTSEGCITGDDKYIYVAAVDHIVRLDPAAPDFAPLPLTVTKSLLDKKTNNCVVSGMASNGKELFVADSQDNCIRVVKPNLLRYFMASNTNVESTREPIDTTGVVNAAPAIVYQSRRVNDYNVYFIPGLKADVEYTVRCHFAAYAEDKPGKLAINIGVSNAKSVNGFDVVAAAGGQLHPVVVDIPGAKVEANGKIHLILDHGWGAYVTICGIEVFDPQGVRVFALNCGGQALEGFQGESDEIPERGFSFERPGPMATDKRGDLWIIQRGNDFPIGTGTSAKYKAAVKCYKTDGTFTGREITDVVNPRALGYDAAKDQLLVAENGADMNVRFYRELETRPNLATTFGEKGGIYSGSNPGLVNDPAAGAYARFAGISGVGVDARGNLYVGGGLQGTDLRMFTPEGKLGWMLSSLVFCNTYDVDPASDGADVYSTYTHVKLDLSKTQPGAEQTYVGYNWDNRKYGDPVGAGGSQSMLRRLGTDKRLFMFTTGQGDMGDINIYRYDGEIAIPAGGTREHGNNLWIDTNGNGKAEPEENVKMTSPSSWISGFCVDSRGDMWVANSPGDGSFMRHFFFKGTNAKGVPIYSGVKDDGYEDIRFPEEGDKTNTWGMKSRLDYDAERDIMVAYFPAVARKGEQDKTPAQYFMARYDNWSKGNRTSKWKVKNFDPLSDPDYFMYEVNPFPYRGHMGMQIAGDYVFFAYLFGEIHVFDLDTGKLVEILSMGPEVNGQCAWEDATMGLRAFKRKNGEYLIFTENSGWGGKNNFFRWNP